MSDRYSLWPIPLGPDVDDSDFYPFDAVGERRTRSEYPYSYDPVFIFGSRAETKAAADGLYSDRIWQWDRDKAERCWKEHVQDNGSQRSTGWSNAGPKRLSAFMSDYLDKPVTVTALAEGCNVGNGYPYWIVWFVHTPENKEDT